MSEAEEKGLSPPQGAVKSYDQLLKLMETRSIPKVDIEFLKNQTIASGNEGKIISGLKFLGLIDKDGNPKEEINSLCVKGELRKENIAKIVRKAYAKLFDVVKLDLANADSDTLINVFKTDYGMGSLTTAKVGALVFVYFAEQADIPLSQDIKNKLSVSKEGLKKINQEKTKKPTIKRKLQEDKSKEDEDERPPLAPTVLARFELVGTGYVDIKDETDFEIAEAYWKALRRKLDIHGDEKS